VPSESTVQVESGPPPPIMASASTPVESVPPQPVPPASSPEDLEAAARREELQKQVDAADAEGEGQGGLV